MALCNVTDKISCIFETEVIVDCTSSKRPNQSYKVHASSSRLRPEAAEAFSSSHCTATEKLDGTCCLIKSFEGLPWLWARHDRKPTKSAEKRFRANVKSVSGNCSFVWRVETDFKDVPENWIPAGSGVPDAGGHIPGWVPVDPKSKTHCWHLSAVDLEETQLALVLKPRISSDCSESELELTVERLQDLDNCTLELIGTNINGNPYKIGSRLAPIHLLVRHGIVPFDDVLPPPDGLAEWFATDAGQVEGIVWHCDGGKMFKLHRHHLNLQWPVYRPRLLTVPVTVNFEPASVSEQKDVSSSEFGGNKLFRFIRDKSGCRFESIADLSLETCGNGV